jgi:hypothetical protein
VTPNSEFHRARSGRRSPACSRPVSASVGQPKGTRGRFFEFGTIRDQGPDVNMRLLVSRNSAEDRLVALLTEGHGLRLQFWRDYRERAAAGIFDAATDLPRYKAIMADWSGRVQDQLRAIFPTTLELHSFSAHRTHMATSFEGIDQKFGIMYHQDMPMYIERLTAIFDKDLRRYTDLPIKERLYVEDIDSFSRVRDVNPAAVNHLLLLGGYLERSEDAVQMALEQILDVSFHKKDWGGEVDDLYTANVVVNGLRRATAFLLKGPGIGRKEMTIADCGKNGDQLVRLFTAPAELFVVQYVGPIAEMLVTDASGKVAALRAQGNDVRFLIMDGQDTARLLHAYGKL